VDVPGTCQYRDAKNLDARLTPFGEQQCEALAVGLYKLNPVHP
jgi:hypothetical protein